MTAAEEILFALKDLAIPYDLVRHEEVHTIEDCAWAQARLGAMVCKNLFLTPRNQSAFYLLVVRPDAVFRTADISGQIGSSRLSFGPAERLMEFLRVAPGAISPLGLLFDRGRRVQLLVDERLKTEARLAFHPNDNAQTLSLASADFFETFLSAVGHQPLFVRLA